MEDAKRFLEGYQKAMRKAKRHEELIAEIRDSRLRISSTLDGMPKSKNINDLSAYAAALDDEEIKYAKAKEEEIRICREIHDKIEEMDNENEKDLLIYRYIEKMTWEEIAEKMNYTYQWVAGGLHKKALSQFQRALDEMQKEYKK